MVSQGKSSAEQCPGQVVDAQHSGLCKREALEELWGMWEDRGKCYFRFY